MGNLNEASDSSLTVLYDTSSLSRFKFEIFAWLAPVRHQLRQTRRSSVMKVQEHSLPLRTPTSPSSLLEC